MNHVSIKPLFGKQESLEHVKNLGIKPRFQKISESRRTKFRVADPSAVTDQDMRSYKTLSLGTVRQEIFEG